MKLLYALAISLLSFGLWANDGAFYASGGNVFPIKETTVALSKEFLKLSIDKEYVNVTVHFHFYNPDDDKTLTVGFVTPPRFGDTDPNTQDKSGVEQFTVNVDGEDLEYRVDQLKEANEELGYHGGEFLYLFDAKFKKGITIVKHSYRIKQATLLGVIFYFEYILQTGKTWANDQIDDFNLEISFDQSTHFSLPADLVEAMDDRSYDSNNRLTSESCTVNNTSVIRGYAQGKSFKFRKRNFKPKTDIRLVLWQDFMSYYTYSSGERSCDLDKKVVNLLDKKVDRKDVRILRNLLFAIHGYEFKSKDLFDYFSQFYWYYPDPEVKNDPSILNQQERRLLDYLLSFAK